MYNLLQTSFSKLNGLYIFQHLESTFIIYALFTIIFTGESVLTDIFSLQNSFGYHGS